jgi:hypothetical protein
MTISVKKYTSDFAKPWNDFVLSSKNGTFLFNRNFVEYHSHRFTDHSLIFFKNEKPIALLAANIVDDTLHSHQGLTYGGVISNRDTKTKDVLNIFKILGEYCADNKISKLIYKRIPSVYCTYPADEDLYALFMINAKLIRRDIGYVIKIQDPIKYIQARRTLFNKATKTNLTVQSSDSNYDEFYDLLESSVARHNIKPAHSSKEMQLLANRFPENIKLFHCNKDGKMICGVWLFIEKNTVHSQYIANSQEDKDSGALELIVCHIMKEYGDRNYFSFGISTENNGKYLNEGLTWQKESFGARGVVHDFYELNFSLCPK